MIKRLPKSLNRVGVLKTSLIMEKFKKFELKDQTIAVGGDVSRTVIYGQDCTPTGSDFYDSEEDQLYNILGEPIECN